MYPAQVRSSYNCALDYNTSFCLRRRCRNCSLMGFYYSMLSVVMTFFSVALHSPTQKFMMFLRVSAPLRYIFYVKKLFISHILRFILSSVNVRVFDWTNDIISQSFPSNL